LRGQLARLAALLTDQGRGQAQLGLVGVVTTHAIALEPAPAAAHADRHAFPAAAADDRARPAADGTRLDE